MLVVSPNFPPVNAPDMHRVRMSLPHFAASGWAPVVLTVEGGDERVIEPELLQSVPADVPIIRVSGWPLSLTRLAGVGNPVLRAWPRLYRAGVRAIREHAIDLVYFSTTMFPALALGRLWRARTGVPFVVDMQDPWVNDYLDNHPGARPPKYLLARLMHRLLEPFTMRAVEAIIAVSPDYHATLRSRYPWLTPSMCATIPFGATEEDLRIAAHLDWVNPWFTKGNDVVDVVYVGRGGVDMRTAAAVFFRALRWHLASAGARAVRVWCIGTDYAPGGQGRPTLAPVAASEGVGALVTESPARIPYFHGLRMLQEADVLVVFGSDDGSYSPSKIYPYLLARRPLITIVHENSPVVGILRGAGAGPVVTFRGAADVDEASRQLSASLRTVLVSDTPAVALPASATAGWLAQELTGRQCEVFDAVLERRAGGAAG